MKKMVSVLPILVVLVFSVLLSACSANSNKNFSSQAAMSSQDVMRSYAQWLRENQQRQNMVPHAPGKQVRLPVRMVEI